MHVLVWKLPLWFKFQEERRGGSDGVSPVLYMWRVAGFHTWINTTAQRSGETHIPKANSTGLVRRGIQSLDAHTVGPEKERGKGWETLQIVSLIQGTGKTQGGPQAGK